MKPTKNQVFCRDCGRTKMLFESEKKAMNFIKFNGEEIKEENGKSPVRAYYCPLCCGWHVTSRAEIPEDFHSRNERWVNNYITQKKNKKLSSDKAKEQSAAVKSEQEKVRKAYDDINQILSHLKRNLDNGKYCNAKDALEFLADWLKPYENVDFMKSVRKSLVDRIDRLTKEVTVSVELYGTEVDMPAILANLGQKLKEADILFDYGMYAEAQSDALECIDILEKYEYCVLMKEDRKLLKRKARALMSLLDSQAEKPAA